MSLAQLGQIALSVSDPDRAERFYGDVLGLPKLFRAGALVFFDLGGLRLMLDGSAAEVQTTRSVCHYFRVAGIEAAAAELAAKGARFVDAPHLVAKLPDHELWMTFLEDPDGHLLALMEEKR